MIHNNERNCVVFKKTAKNILFPFFKAFKLFRITTQPKLRKYLQCSFSSVIRQKGESENGCFKKTKHAKFPEKQTFLTSWYVVCVSGGKKCLFFWKFGVLCFLETPVLRFVLLPYYRLFNLFHFCIHTLHSALITYIVLSNIASIVFENNCIWKSPLLKLLNATLQFHSDVRIWVLMIITKEIIAYNMMQRLNFSIMKDQTLRQTIPGNYEKRNAQNQYFLSLLVLRRLLKTFNGILLLYVLIMSRRCLRVNPHSIAAWMSRTPCSKQARNLKFKWLQRNSNPQPHSS